MNGLTTLTQFLDYLSRKRIRFTIVQSRDDAVMVSFALVGERYEIEFMEDHLEVCVFRGDESVTLDLAPVIARIEEDKA
jgi:hypothetical protein